jgi:selenocysteine-specific elongation factor
MTHTLTLGLIGHVDHGKSALVRALTGIETDRLREERERGMSIVLGFAYVETPHGVIDLIDVPGHEDFIRAMIAGSTGFDGAVLVVAANEGVMPQTREHFDIARLLELDRGIVVINKADLVSEQELEAMTAGIRDFVRGSFLEGAPIIATSATVGQGIDTLRNALAELAVAPMERQERRGFYLPLDRVFTLRGFGVVGTGTLRGGRVRVNDRVQIMPGDRTATVRALQSRNQPIQEALPGQRVAINLRNVGREEIARGSTIATPGLLTLTRQVDVELRLLDSEAMAQEGLRNGANVRLLIGTTEAMAKVRLLDRDSLPRGATGLAQLRCDRDLATREGERFIVRSYSPMITIGGGRILDASPGRHRRFDASVTHRLETVAAGDVTATLRQLVAESGLTGIEAGAAAERLGLSLEALRAAAGEADVLAVGDRLIAQAGFAQLLEDIAAAVSRHHRDYPRERGVAAGRIRSALSPEPHEAVFRRAVADLAASGTLSNDGDMLSLPDFDILAGLDESERAAAAELEKAFLEFGVAPPPPLEVVGREKQRGAAYRLLLEKGLLVRLRIYDRGTPLVLHAATLDDVERRLRQRYPHPATFALADVRDMLDTTRRFALPILEHFDATGVTIKLGDVRRLREQ